MNHIQSALSRDLEFIASEQINGGFASLSQPSDGSAAFPVRTTFVTSLILGCLDNQDGSQDIIRQGLNFLAAEQSQTGGWNYWQRLPENADKRCPDDWDDTACALIAFSRHHPGFITPELLANLTRWLIATEEQPGGPYHTWFIGGKRDDVWRDLDPIVNANIAYFLKLQDISVPRLTSFLDEACTKGSSSRYYYHPIVSAYFLSRAVSLSGAVHLKKRLLSVCLANNSWGKPLYTALAISSLLRLGVRPPAAALDSLITTAVEHAFEPTPLYIEEIPNQPNYAGATSLTAAFIYEALRAWQEYQTAAPTIQSPKRLRNIHSAVIHSVRQRLNCLPKSLQPDIASLLDRIVLTDTGQQITVLPACFAFGLKNPIADQKKLIRLGIANLCGWIAYTMYDDMLDEDTGPDLLPAANLCLRDTITVYENILPNGFKPLFSRLMDNMEKANAWERMACRLPGGQKMIKPADIPTYPPNLLADKSLPHALGPIAILADAGYAPDSLEIKKLTAFFGHYLTARQLNDDAHDWFDDLKKGFINGVAAGLLRRYMSQEKTDCLYPMRQQRKLCKLFWEKEIDVVTARIFRHLHHARSCLKDLSDIINTDFLEQLLAPIEQATNEAIVGKRETLAFMKAFKSENSRKIKAAKVLTVAS